MGVSTNAILIFGIDYEEGELPLMNDEDDSDFEKIVAEAYGVKEPEVEYSDETTEEYRKYWAKQREVMNQIPVVMETHCSDSCPMYILGLSKTRVSANRGDPATFDRGALETEITDRDIELFKEFYEKFNIEWQEPKWLLCSYWG